MAMGREGCSHYTAIRRTTQIKYWNCIFTMHSIDPDTRGCTIYTVAWPQWVPISVCVCVWISPWSSQSSRRSHITNGPIIIVAKLSWDLLHQCAANRKGKGNWNWNPNRKRNSNRNRTSIYVPYNQLTWVIDPSTHPTIHQWRVLVNQVGAIYLKGQSMRDEVGLKLNK